MKSKIGKLRSVKLGGTIAISAALLVGCSIEDAKAEFLSFTEDLAASDVGSAGPDGGWDGLVELVSNIEISEELTGSGYDRDDYPHWKSAYTEWGYPEEYSQCTTREYTLYRDGVNIYLDPKTCYVFVEDAGGWTDPYGKVDGDEIIYPFTDKRSEVDIDHIVPLKEIWRSSTDPLSDEDREAIANDPVNLIATSASVNRSKGDSDAEDYLPPDPTMRCEYIDRYAAVKVGYGLTAQQGEYDRLMEEAAKCQGQ